MADDTTIIEGSVKFRDGKKWKARWCVMRRLSPVADCVQLQLYRDWKARAGGGEHKAALSLQHYLGCESGFTLDKQSHTLALVCRDLVAVLAFETRERLVQWQAKAGAALGGARAWLVLVVGGTRRVPAGPARLLLHRRRAALTAGAPPRLLGVWELAHLRRFGVVEGRFCFEGGSRCGRGEGPHVLIADRAEDIAADFDLASRGLLSPGRRPVEPRGRDGGGSPTSHRSYGPDARLSELHRAEGSLPEPRRGRDGAASPRWPSAELGLGDAASVHESSEGADAGAEWGAGGGVALERCTSCMSKLGALSRSSTAALTPGARHFSPAWTMDAQEPRAAPCAAPCPAPCPVPCPSPCPRTLSLQHIRSSAVGPYENYDVPKLASLEVEGEYYDTPKRLKECLNNELFKMTKSATFNSVILKKPCGCLLRLGKRRKEPRVVESDEAVPPASCACRRVTDWANSWIRLPYCKKNTVSGDDLAPNKENVKPSVDNFDALYATIDLSRKTRRKTHPLEPDELRAPVEPRSIEIDDGPLANYENLNFALSLEYYENAKDLLRRAGVTQSELNAISANLRPAHFPEAIDRCQCSRCGAPRPAGDDYLMMEPEDGARHEPSKAPPAGYTPMSPIGGFAFDTLKRPPRDPFNGLPEEKSASDPALGGPDEGDATGAAGVAPDTRPSRASDDRMDRVEYRKRSSSADSSRFLEDVEEFEDGGGRGSASSMETLRDLAPDQRAGAACACGAAPARGPAAHAAGNRDSSSSNDSGVSSCSLRRGGERFELPPTTAAARRHYRRAAAARRAAPPAPRRSRSTDPLRESPRRGRLEPKSSSAEAEVPVLPVRPARDAHSTSSGTSDMSDYIETLSICSSHSSTDTPITMRQVRQTTSTLRPRSGKEYRPLPPRLACELRAPPLPPPAPYAAPHAAPAPRRAAGGERSQEER